MATKYYIFEPKAPASFLPLLSNRVYAVETTLFIFVTKSRCSIHFRYQVSLQTYIQISSQPFSQYYNLVSHITYLVCINFIHEWRELSERQIFINISWQFNLALRVFAINLRGSWRKNFFYIFRSFGNV